MRRSRLACALGCICTVLAAISMTASAETINFEGIAPEQIVCEVYGDLGTGPIGVHATNPDLEALWPGSNAAVIFDSAFPVGSIDRDLGTPNTDFGGPGVGTGGQSGSPFQNDTALGHLLIINEASEFTDRDANNVIDCDDSPVDIQNDADNPGAPIMLDFSAVGAVTISSITLIDVEANEQAATVELYGAGDVLLAMFTLPQTGDNGVAVVSLGPTANVVKMEIVLNGSGGIDNVVFGPPELCGNGVVNPGEQCDDGNTSNDDGCDSNCMLECGNGVLDPGEQCDDGNATNGDGCDANCEIEPFCGDGNLDPGEQCDDGNTTNGDGCDANCDIEQQDFEGCTPGYWKQSQHFGSWVGYVTTDHYGTVFGVNPSFGNITLLAALAQGGGGQAALGRHASAALLNTSNSSVNYQYTTAQVIALVQAAYVSGDFEGAKSVLAAANERQCPLGRATLTSMQRGMESVVPPPMTDLRLK